MLFSYIVGYVPVNRKRIFKDEKVIKKIQNLTLVSNLALVQSLGCGQVPSPLPSTSTPLILLLPSPPTHHQP